MNPAKLDIALVRKGGFAEFTRLAYPLFESTPFVETWATRAVCRELEAAYRQDERLDVILNLPPGHSKSSILSLWQVWTWILDPGHRFFFGSYASELGKREGGKIVALAHSEWFQARWPAIQFVDVKRSANADPNVSILQTKRGGLRFSSTPKGKVLGWHFDTHIIDDPHKPSDMGEKTLKATSDWVRRTLATRWRGSRQVRVLGMQRLSVQDLSAQFEQDSMADGAAPLRKIAFPLEYDPRIQATLGSSVEDERKAEGELLSPRYTRAAVLALKARIGAEGDRSAQLQQNPLGTLGKVFRKEWFRQWSTLPDSFDIVADFWDLTFDNEGADPDYVAGQRWGKRGPDFYLIARAPTLRLNFPDTLRAIAAFKRNAPCEASACVVEKKANGAAVLSTMRVKVPGMIGYEPRGSKVERACAASVYCESGNTYLGPNDGDLIAIATAFPAVNHDDEIDCMSMGINYLAGKGADWTEAKALAALEGMFK
jgi:predicted phage terminase large subunit-like protein